MKMTLIAKISNFNKQKLGLFSLYGLVVLLPFIVFYWMLPFYGNTTIGNDYVNFSPPQQVELQYSIEHGTWPLFSPGFAGGRPSAALTLGQLFHPISHIAALIPGYWDGHSLNIVTLLRLLSLGIAHLVLLILLGRLRLRLDLAFLISFITVYNLRMLDTFRFGASLEGYTGQIYLIAALGFYFLKPNKVTGPVAIIAATFLLVVSGHPQMMYFGMIASGIGVLLIPFVLPTIRGDAPVSRAVMLRFYGSAGVMITAGVGLAAAYVVPLYFDFVSETAARAGNNYGYSLMNCDSWGGELNNFFQPLHAAVTGVFGGSSIIAVVLLIPLLAVARARQPKTLYIVFGVFTLVFVIALGQATLVHRWFWEYFPLASTFRVPGRITMMLPIFIMLLFGLIMSRETKDLTVWKRDLKIPVTTALFCGALVIFVLYELLLKDIFPGPTHPLPERFRKDFPDWIFTFVFWSGVATLTLAAAHGLRWKWRTVIGVLLILGVMTQTIVQLRYGTWTRNYGKTLTLEQIDRQKTSKMDFRGHPGAKMQSDLIDQRMRRSFLETDPAKFYRKYMVATSQGEAFAVMGRERRADTIVVEGFDRSSGGSKQAGGVDRVLMTYSSFNRFGFKVQNKASGFLSLTFLGDNRWSAIVDGESAAVYRANAGEAAVYLEPGEHVVEYRFESLASVVGMVISLVFLGLIGGLLCYRRLKGRGRFVGVGVSLMIAVLLFAFWRSSLYSGDNLETKYSWSSDQFSNPDNLAFGKPTKMSSLQYHQRPFLNYAGRGVDGDRTAPGFKTKRGKKRPWWQVDLGEYTPIGEIVIYGCNRITGHLPLRVMVSKDGKKFEAVKTVESDPRTRTLRIDLEGVLGRFVRLLSSSNKLSLGFKEVEILPPGHPSSLQNN